MVEDRSGTAAAGRGVAVGGVFMTCVGDVTIVVGGAVMVPVGDVTTVVGGTAVGVVCNAVLCWVSAMVSRVLLTSPNTSMVRDFPLSSSVLHPYDKRAGERRGKGEAGVGPTTMSLSSEGARLPRGEIDAALATMVFSLLRSDELKLFFLRMVPFLPVDLSVVPARMFLSKLSMMQPSSSWSGGAALTFPPAPSPLASALFLLAASATFLAASRLIRFSSRTMRWTFSYTTHYTARVLPPPLSMDYYLLSVHSQVP